MAITGSDLSSSLSTPNELTGIFRARVENNVDPLHIGRVQVRIPMLHRLQDVGTKVENLPWATMCSNNGAGFNYGSFIVPEVGEYVFVMFEDGDSSKPVVLGSIFGTNSTTLKKYGTDKTTGVWTGVKGANEVPLESQREYPSHKMLYKSRLGSMVYVDTDEKTNAISMEDAYNQKVTISSNEDKQYVLIQGANNEVLKIHDGKIDIGYEGGQGIQVIPGSGQITLKASGATITISDNITMTASKVSINAPATINGNVRINGNCHVVD